MGWQPIETAPRDGREIDIWIVPPSRREKGDYPIFMGACAFRIPDARPCYGNAWQDATGRTVTGRRFYDDNGDQCLDPDDISDRAIRATHWRPIPSAPASVTRNGDCICHLRAYGDCDCGKDYREVHP